jgi:putative membrane protein
MRNRGDPVALEGHRLKGKEYLFMKSPLKSFVMAATLAAGALTLPAFADSASDFADEASAKGLAEIQTSKLALQKSNSADVRQFAQKMIDDHTQANRELATVAQNAKVKLSDDAALMDKAKKFVLEQRDGQGFDAAYADNQVAAHEQTIELFEEYLRDGDNNYLKAFARETLPKLKHHLQAAQELQRNHP